MVFAEKLRDLATRIPLQLEHIETEEATKNSLVLPFLQALGYNIFDPREVLPEFTADVGTKKGEKIDFALLAEGKPIILIECKTHRVDLDKAHMSQLFRYFGTTDTRFGILTNGIRYRFFSDLERPNRMDVRPFLEINLLDLADRDIEELARFSSEAFDESAILETAASLKYIRAIKRALSEEWAEPSDAFVRFLAARVHEGRITPTVRESIAGVTKSALREFVHERVRERLTSALANESLAVGQDTIEETHPGEAPEEAQETEPSGVVTTSEEIEAHLIVKSILRETTDVSRIAMRDAKSYCSILLDNNNRKTICRFRFDTKQKYLGLIDEQKTETRVPIDTLDDIFQHATRLAASVFHYDKPS